MNKVERWQAEKIKQAVGPMLRYLTLLRERMERTGLAQADRFMQTVHRAWEGVYALTIAVHYVSCEGGAGRKLEERP
jgi:hypothetical protein